GGAVHRLPRGPVALVAGAGGAHAPAPEGGTDGGPRAVRGRRRAPRGRHGAGAALRGR
ncbi:MAG: hypothetical protein AVDCRST_MAG89-4951, partial [uncultured Gemmatimonadetes bacterium]